MQPSFGNRNRPSPYVKENKENVSASSSSFSSSSSSLSLSLTRSSRTDEDFGASIKVHSRRGYFEEEDDDEDDAANHALGMFDRMTAHVSNLSLSKLPAGSSTKPPQPTSAQGGQGQSRAAASRASASAVAPNLATNVHALSSSLSSASASSPPFPSSVSYSTAPASKVKVQYRYPGVVDGVNGGLGTSSIYNPNYGKETLSTSHNGKDPADLPHPIEQQPQRQPKPQQTRVQTQVQTQPRVPSQHPRGKGVGMDMHIAPVTGKPVPEAVTVVSSGSGRRGLVKPSSLRGQKVAACSSSHFRGANDDDSDSDDGYNVMDDIKAMAANTNMPITNYIYDDSNTYETGLATDLAYEGSRKTNKPAQALQGKESLSSSSSSASSSLSLSSSVGVDTGMIFSSSSSSSSSRLQHNSSRLSVSRLTKGPIRTNASSHGNSNSNSNSNALMPSMSSSGAGKELTGGLDVEVKMPLSFSSSSSASSTSVSAASALSSSSSSSSSSSVPIKSYQQFKMKAIPHGPYSSFPVSSSDAPSSSNFGAPARTKVFNQNIVAGGFQKYKQAASASVAPSSRSSTPLPSSRGGGTVSSAVASFYNDDRCDSSDDDDVDDHNDSDDGGGGRVIIMKAGGSASSKSVPSTGPFTSSSSASKAPKAPVLHLNDLDMGMADEDETDDHLIDDILQDLSAAYDKTLPTEIQQIIVAQQKFKQQQNALRNSSSNY